MAPITVINFASTKAVMSLSVGFECGPALAARLLQMRDPQGLLVDQVRERLQQLVVWIPNRAQGQRRDQRPPGHDHREDREDKYACDHRFLRLNAVRSMHLNVVFTADVIGCAMKSQSM